MPIPPQPARIRIREADGTPSARVGTIIVSNGNLTDNGDGTVTLAFSADPSVLDLILTDSDGQVLSDSDGYVLYVGS